MEYNIGNSESQINRISILINYLTTLNSNATFKEIQEHYKEKKINQISIWQFRKDKKFLIDSGIDISCNAKNEYSIDGDIPQSIKKVLVDDEIKNELPILFNLLNTEENLAAIKWLKKLLNKKYNINEEEWNKKDYFSSPVPELPYQDEVIRLSIDIIKHINKRNILTFKYKPVDPTKSIEFPIVAPLQIRLYDGRYYLYGAEKINGNYNLSQLKVMAIDQIRDWEVKEYLINGKAEKFDYDNLLTKSRLKFYTNYCIGVTIPKEEERIIYNITIRFYGWAKSYVKNKYIHHSQIEVNKKLNQGKDYVDIQITVYKTFELDFILEKFRSFKEIISKKIFTP